MCFRPPEMSMNKCQKCGKEARPIDKECAECGTILDPGVAPSVGGPSAPGGPGVPIVPPKAPLGAAPSAPKTPGSSNS